ncbi:MAG: serine hydrolase domain-containing protein [Phycisphaerae bacterium]|nr:serine hydrolase domain-containing protein [Phycisphaerae bacterium]
MHNRRLCFALSIAFAVVGLAALASAQEITPDLVERRKQFLAQELITSRPFQFIFNPGQTPRVIWRDAEEVRRLGMSAELRVRWFDGEFREAPVPDAPGRWAAVIEGTAPNGTPLRRGLTFFCRGDGFIFWTPADETGLMPARPSPVPPAIWEAALTEVRLTSRDAHFRAMNDTEAGAILMAGFFEAAREATSSSAPSSANSIGVSELPDRGRWSPAMRNDEYHLRLKLRLLAAPRAATQPAGAGAARIASPLAAPRRRENPAPMLREGTPREARVSADAKAKIDAICRDWAADSGEPFVTLVARDGVIITHEAYGKTASGVELTRAFRQDVFSITKTLTAMLFGRFLDQRRIELDASVASVFDEYPKNAAHVPTFRQCLTHTSGLSGHGDWGGARNPYFENIILNAIDVNLPGRKYEYSGMGYDLTAKAMERLSGKSILRLFHEDLFAPLGMHEAVISGASSGAQLTAYELAVLAQTLANGGSYGEIELFSPETLQRMLPVKLADFYPGIPESEGIGLHWKPERRPGAPPDSAAPEHLALGMRTFGHGSLSACILRIDPETGVIVTQMRSAAGPRFGEWSAKMFAAIADSIER